MRLRISLLLFGALTLGSCGEAATEPDIGFTLTTLDMEPPDDLVCVSVLKSEDGGAPAPLFVRNLASLEDPDEDGDPELTIDALPAAGTPFELIVEGYTTENCGGMPAYVARSGVVRLQPGERRFLEMAFYAVQEAEALVRGDLPDSPLLPTATALPDGRVLLAGGFVDLTAGDCPTGVTGTCFEAEASAAAWVFDPPTGKFFEVQGGMGTPRGGHTATALEDGRVLIAGGAAAVRMAIVPGASGTSAAIFLQPYDDAGAPDQAHDTFEIFEPEANPELPEDDLFRDGDPGRGGFFGSASNAGEPGALNQQRFLHAAALTASGTVVLAGGMGMGAADTFEHFDARRPGGYGVYDNTGSTLRAPRIAPSAVALETSTGAAQVWIIGGTTARDNDALAEIWTPSDDVLSGVTQPATTAANFPAPVDGGTGMKPERPRFSLMRPQVAPLGGGSMAMVNGWYGPRCPTATEAPYFPPMGELGVICPKSNGANFRNFTVAAEDGTTVDWQASSSRFQSFGAVAVLADGRVVVTGGIEDEALITSNDLSIYRAEPADNGKPVAAGAQSLAIPRAFHAAAPLRGGGILVFGGLTITSGTTVRSTTPAGEAFFL